jgi:hypothetical protein
MTESKLGHIALGGLVVTCLLLDLRFEGLNPAEDDGILRVIKIGNTTSFREETEQSVPCRKILRHVKEPCEYERDTSEAKFTGDFFAKYLVHC